MHLRAGFLLTAVDPGYALQAARLNGTRQQEMTIYAPSFQNPQTPVTGSISVNTIWQLPKTFQQIPAFNTPFALEHEFPHHWHAEGNFNYGANWDQIREENINAPVVASNTGAPRKTLTTLRAKSLSDLVMSSRRVA